MSVLGPLTDLDQLTELQLKLLEPDDAGATWPSGYWTREEVLATLTDRQRRFVKDTQLVLAQQLIAVTSGTETVALPTDWIATIRAVWRAKPAGVVTSTTPLGRSSQFAGDHGWSRAVPPASPVLFDDQHPAQPAADLIPTPATDGDLHLLYVASPDAVTGDGDLFAVPEEYVPFITYGVLATLLGKQGRGQDLPRAAYCEQRYQEGVALAALQLRGFF